MDITRISSVTFKGSEFSRDLNHMLRLFTEKRSSGESELKTGGNIKVALIAI